ncbi:MAG: zinc ribbon domain-containing protein [Rubrivivax sp.]|nr:zinc ribbon domain-containing protein [Rubrivivax sp.]
MPIYDFRCSACDQVFELVVRGSLEPACPHCASTALQRQVSLTAPQGTSKAIIASARQKAQAEGHFSHYSKAERRKAGV